MEPSGRRESWRPSKRWEGEAGASMGEQPSKVPSAPVLSLLFGVDDVSKRTNELMEPAVARNALNLWRRYRIRTRALTHCHVFTAKRTA